MGIIVCNLKSQFLKRDYELVEMYEKYSWVALCNPTCEEAYTPFEVETSEIINARTRTDDSSEVAVELPMPYRAYDPEDREVELEYPGVLM